MAVKVLATGVFDLLHPGHLKHFEAAKKKGDILVDLPYKVNRTNKSRMAIRAHQFTDEFHLTLPLFDKQKENDWQQKYLYATASQNVLSQKDIAMQLGVSQGTVSHWQRGVGSPRAISRKYFKHEFPEEITKEITEDILKEEKVKKEKKTTCGCCKTEKKPVVKKECCKKDCSCKKCCTQGYSSHCGVV